MSRLIVSNIETQNIKFDSDTTAMTIDGSGNSTFAKNISQTDLQFWTGYHDATETPGAGGTLGNWSESANNGITESSGIWTVSVAGLYLFSISVIGNSANGGIYWHHNSTQKWRIGYGQPPSGDTSAWQTMGGTLLHQFAANDTLKFTAQSATSFYGDNATSSVSSMFIFKVG